MWEDRAGDARTRGTVTRLQDVADGPRRTGRAWQHNLPAPLTSFIGREQEATEIAHLLATTRLLTLTGTPGVGKTRLALEVAAELVEQFPDGVRLVELAPLTDPDLVPQAVAAALGLREQPGRTVPDTLTDALRFLRMLLVLDNCEHLVDACAGLADGLLRACPGLVILATSREPLGIDGETAWRVPSLALPAGGDGETVASGDAPTPDACPSVRLFVERARAARPDLALTVLHTPSIARICRRLDGIPLALELAAARVKALSVDQIASRLDDRFRLLTGGNRTALPHQRTLRATVDWSYDLLSEEERTLLRRLAVFAGGWSLEAAEAVCAGDRIESSEVLDLLHRLVDRSLVVTEVYPDGTNRFRMLEMLQQYALERLVERGEADTARYRHAGWFLALAERAEPELRGPHEREWSERLEGECENLRAALRWLVERGEAERSLRLGSALWRFWSVRGHLIEGLDWLEQVLALSGASGDVTDQVLRARAGALNGAGNLAAARGEHARAVTFLGESLALRRQLADPAGVAISLHNLGMAARNLGDRALAQARFDESLTLFRQVGDTRNAGLSLLNLGRLSHDAGDRERATTLYADSLAHFRAAGSAQGIATALNRLGELARDRGDLTAAVRLHEEALSMHRDRADPWGIGLSLTGLARVAVVRGDRVQSKALAVESVRALHDAGANRDTAAALVVLAAAAGATGQAAIGAQLLGAVAKAYPEGSAIGAEQTSFEQALAATRVALGEEAFAAAWTEGQRLTLDQAVDLALGLAETAPPVAAAPAEHAAGTTAGVSAGAAPGSSVASPAGPPVSALTPREREVAALIASGLTNRQIAEELIISEMTADSHVSHILRKLGFRSRAQVARWAVEHGLRPPEAD
jgi:predicted ATPase/DNA-binding NarL/FixJ family response regulator